MRQPNKTKAKSYDEQFLKDYKQSDDFKNWSKNSSNVKLANTNAFDFELHRVDFDSSNEDYINETTNPFLNQFADFNSNDPYNEIRSYNQPWVDKAGALLGRATVKALTEVAKLPGVIGGMVVAPFVKDGEGMDMAFNNAFIRVFDDLNEAAKTELMPVYVKKAVSEGNLWDNITSIDFWATDGADGIGFIAAMFVPGAIFEYAGLGGKLIKGLSNSKKLASATSMTGKAESGVNAAKFLGMSGKAIDSRLAVMGNTIFEAGAEAKSVGDGLDHEKPKFIKQQLNKGLSLEQAESLFKEQRALAMKNTFISNVGILLGPNAMMHKAIWGKAADKFERVAETGFKDVVKTGFKGVTKTGFKGVAKRAGTSTKRVLKAFGSEGLWEEGSQTTVEKMFTNKAMDGSLKKDYGSDFSVDDFSKEYINTLNTVDGQKAIFLGGALGGPMMSYQGRDKDVKNREKTNKVFDNLDAAILNFNTIFENDVYQKQKNEDGTESYVYKKDKDGSNTTEREIIPAEVLKVVKSLNMSEAKSQEFEEAVENGDVETVEKLKQEAIFDLVGKAVNNGEMGLKVLEQQLNENSKFQDILARDNDPQTKKENKTKSFIKETLDTARFLQKQSGKFQDFGKDVISLKDERATSETKNQFLEALHQSYLKAKHEQRQNEIELAKLDEKRDSIYDELGLDKGYDPNSEFPMAGMKSQTVTNEPLNEIAERTKKALSSNMLLKFVELKRKVLAKDIKKSKEDISKVWQGGDEINESYSSFLDKLDKVKEELSPEKVEEATQAVQGIKNAKNKAELDSVLSPDKTENLSILQILNEISESINNDDSLENLKNNLEKLKFLNSSSVSVVNVIKELEDKVLSKIKEKEEFEDFLNELIDVFDKETNELNEFLSSINSEITDLLKQKDVLLKALQNQSKSPKGRYAKLVKELIKDSEDSLKKIEDQIEYLTGIKNEIKKELKQIDKNLEYIFNRYDQIEKSNFSSVSDIVDYLEKNKERFKEHRHSLERLLVTKLNSEEHIEYLDHSVEALTNYADVLRDTIKSFLTIEGKIKTESVDDHKFVKEELIKTTKALYEAQKELKSEKEKLNRLTKSIIDKLSITAMKDEIAFWKDLQNYKKSEINPLLGNTYIQELISEKEAEFKKQEAEEAEESKEEQTNLEEEQIINNPEEVEEINSPSIIIDENGEFQSESIPTSENEDEDNEVVDNENISEEEVDKQLSKEISGAKIISTVRSKKGEDNPENGNAIFPNLQAFVDYERTPRDKSNDTVTFDIGDISNGDVELAYNKLIKGKKLSPKEIKLLEDKLPIRVNIEYVEGGEVKTVSSYIEAKSKANQAEKDSKEALEKQTMPLRKNIIKEAIKNKSLSGITSKVVKQYPGLLKVDYNEEGVAKNDIFDLQVFDGMTDEQKVDYFQKNTGYVNWEGNLISTINSLQTIKTNFGESHKGEVFLRISQNNGTDFWLKLNVAKISEEKAEAVYEIVKALSQTSPTIANPTTFQGMTIDSFFDMLSEQDDELSKRIQEVLAYEIALVKTFNKGKSQNESLSRFLDLVIYHKSQNKKTGFKLSKDGNLTLGSLAEHLIMGNGFKHLLTITKDELITPEAKDIIMNYVQYKRHNILITRDSVGSFVFNNKEYVKYLLNSEQPLLTTNAVVKQPTFQGYSNVYLNQEVNNSEDITTTKTKTNKTTVKDVISDKDWNNFVDNNIVDDKILSDIAYKIKDNKMLSIREQAILAENTSKIEDLLKLITKEVVVEAVDNNVINEEGVNIATKAAFDALLKIKTQPQSKEDVKMDISYVKESYKKADAEARADIIFALAENLNMVDDIDFENINKSFDLFIKTAVSRNKSVDEINKICGI
jgi:hypothetical protein